MELFDWILGGVGIWLGLVLAPLIICAIAFVCVMLWTCVSIVVDAVIEFFKKR